MSLKLQLELDTETLDFKIKETDLAKGERLTWGDLVHIRNSIDNLLERRERIDARAGQRGAA